MHNKLALDPVGTGPDHYPVGGRDRGPVGRDGEADAARERERALVPRHRDSGQLQRRRGQRLVQRVESRQQPPELEAAEELLQLRAIGRREHQLGRIEVELEVTPHGRELLRQAGLIGVLCDGTRASGRELARVLDHGLEGAEAADQLTCGLVADAGDARDVVRRVALEPDEVGHLVGPDAVAGLDPSRRVDVDVGDTAGRHHQADVVRAQLERIPVGRDDAGADALGVGARGERGDHVVGLPALELEVAVPERLDERPEARELLAQQVRHRLAALLVDHVGRPGQLGSVHGPRVPRHRDRLRPVVGKQLEEHVREPEQRVRRHAVRGRELLGQREERAISEIVAVDEEEV